MIYFSLDLYVYFKMKELILPADQTESQNEEDHIK